MLTSPTALRDRLSELDGDLGLLPGRRLVLLGFRDGNAVRVADNLRTLEAPPWTLVDARPSTPGVSAIRPALEAALSAEKLALVVEASALPTDVALLIRALHDANDAVSWADGGRTPVPQNRILYVLAHGARDATELPPLLARIDFMDFIRPPE